MKYEGFGTHKFWGGRDKLTQHEALKLICGVKLTFDERVVPHRVEIPPECLSIQTSVIGAVPGRNAASF